MSSNRDFARLADRRYPHATMGTAIPTDLHGEFLKRDRLRKARAGSSAAPRAIGRTLAGVAPKPANLISARKA